MIGMEEEYSAQDTCEELISQIIKIAKDRIWHYEIKVETQTNVFKCKNGVWEGLLHRDDNFLLYKDTWIKMAFDPENKEMELYKGTANNGQEFYVWADDWAKAVEKLEKYQLYKLELATNKEKKNLKPHIENPQDVIWVEI